MLLRARIRGKVGAVDTGVRQAIEEIFRESGETALGFLRGHADQIEAVAGAAAATLRRGGTLILFGNGGSATQAQHLAAEFVNRFQVERPALPALALTADVAALTSIANDRGVEALFARQLEALGRPGDMAFALSTSGRSPNVLKAVEVARSRRMATVALTGAGGDALAARCDFAFVVPSRSVARIQEVHLLLGHTLCHLVEAALFPAPAEVGR